jgi:DNA-directed RNA polymerase specialized sigma24 family protein
MAVVKKKYMSAKDLYVEIIISKNMGKLTPRAVNMLILLAKKAQTKLYYRSIDDKNDCLQEAMLDVFKFWYNFDESKGSNAFAYFTEIIKRGMARGWNKIHKTKGADVEIISLTAFSENGDSYERF